MLKKILIFIILFIGLLNTTSGIYVSSKVEWLYAKVVLKIESKYDLVKQEKVLVWLKSKINSLKKQSKYKNNKKILSLLEQILYLNDKKIILIRKEIILEKIREEGSKKDVIKSSAITDKNLDIYEKEFELEKVRRQNIVWKYKYSSYFKNISYTKNNIFLENGIWKAYTFKTYSFFPEDSNITKKDLEYNGINLETDLLFVTNKNTLWFVKNPKKVILISDDLIKNIKNKYYFLEEVLDDMKNSLVSSYDYDFKKLKLISEKLTYNLSDSSKIWNIYNYVLNNTDYSKVIDFKDYRIFSWIETFKNNDWVCEWYAKMMVYMMMFAWYEDVEVIRWYVIDAQDFPDVWHAWVRVWDRYYDPTFDDPVWATENKKSKDYKYFDLPEDLFYTNRYNEDELPSYIRTLSLENREKLIVQNIYSISEKYKNSDYKLLKLIKFKKEHNIKYDEKITLNNFSKFLPKRTVSDFSFIQNWTKKQIVSLSFYNIDTFDLELLLEQLNYNLDWYYFFEWYDKDWKKTYRLGYNVVIR